MLGKSPLVSTSFANLTIDESLEGVLNRCVSRPLCPIFCSDESGNNHDHVARFIVNANHSIVRAAVMLGIADCVADRIRSVVPQATEWQRIGD